MSSLFSKLPGLTRRPPGTPDQQPILPISEGPIVRKLILRCSAVSILFIILALTNHAIRREYIDQTEDSALLISISGKQRMRLLQATNHSVRLLEASTQTDTKELRNNIRQLLADLESNHQTLLHGNEAMQWRGIDSPSLRALFFEPPMALNNKLAAFFEALRDLANLPRESLLRDHPDYIRILRVLSAEEIISAMDQAVDGLILKKQSDLRRMGRYSDLLLWSNFALVLLMGLFIFRPMIRSVDRSFGAYQSLNRDLEKQISARILELNRKNEDLEIHSTELARSNEELDNFAYVASHDLKAPLRDIDNLAQWIEEDAGETLPNPCRLHLAKLKGRIHRMETLLDDLLQYSRAGRIIPCSEEFDSGELMDEVCEVVGVASGFEIRKEGQWPILRTPKTPLQQILMNLVDNAAKHHDRTTGVIRVSATDNETYAEFCVTDDGPGIPEQYRERIFRMFQRLQSNEDTRGSGIGLALVKKLIETIGGTLSVESATPRGTTFRFTWPKEWKRE